MQSQQDLLSSLPSAVRKAQGCQAFLRSLGLLLEQAQRDIAAYEPICRACGRCCDFAQTDHRLYVSTGELALLCWQRAQQAPAPLHCAYQHGQRCMARDRRPLGCRVFFCDETAQAAGRDLYERYHRQIVARHGEFGVEYHYTELSAGLARLACNPQIFPKEPEENYT